MRESSLIDQYPPWVQYYAPLLNDYLNETYADVPLAGTAEFLADVGPRVAESFDLAPEDVDQLATRANLNAWAELVTQFFNRRDSNAGTGQPMYLDWRRDWFAVPEQPARPSDQFDRDRLVEALLSDSTLTALLPEEYGRIVTALVWVLDLYDQLIDLDDELEPMPLLQPHDGSVPPDDLGERFEEHLDQYEFTRACLVVLGQVTVPASAIAAVEVHASVLGEISEVLDEITEDRDELAAMLAAVPTENNRRTVMPDVIEHAQEALRAHAVRLEAERQLGEEKRREAAHQAAERRNRVEKERRKNRRHPH